MDAKEHLERQARRTREAVAKHGDVLRPLAAAVVGVIRGGGRVLVAGEGRLQLLAEFCAVEVLAAAREGLRLPADPLPLVTAGAQASARCIGPYDGLLAIVDRCDPPFGSLLEAARARGAKVLCICVGPSRLEERADVAIDVPEQRAHRIPGLVASLLHYVAKMAIAELRANPLVRPTRLDHSDRRDAQRSAAPSLAAAATAEDVEEPTITLELPDDAFEIPFVDQELGPEVYATPRPAPPAAAPWPAAEPAPPPQPGAASSSSSARVGLALGRDEPDDDEEVEYDPPARAEREAQGPAAASPATAAAGRVIMFRCKRCREPLLADPTQAGARAGCPFCERRVKIPRSGGRPFRTGRSALSQATREVSLRFSLRGCGLTLLPHGGMPLEARLDDVTPEGLEVSLQKSAAETLREGVLIRVRLDTAAFLEPLMATAVLERRIDDGVNGEEIGRTRLLLPLQDDTPREVRERFVRLAELAERTASGRHPPAG